MSRPRHRKLRVLGTLAGTAIGLLVFADAAAAHVTVQPPTANAGGYATLSFKVPNESDTASTVGLEIQLPTDPAIPSVSVQPKAGWTYEITRGEPAEPVMVHGTEVNEVVTHISWKAEEGNEGIKVGEFDTFTISAGQLPEGVESLTFKALQTYSDGDVVRWIEEPGPGGEDPEKPAPVLRLTAADDDGEEEASSAETTDTAETTEAADTTDDTARGLGFAGLVLGAFGLGVGVAALMSGRRRGSKT